MKKKDLIIELVVENRQLNKQLEQAIFKQEQNRALAEEKYRQLMAELETTARTLEGYKDTFPDAELQVLRHKLTKPSIHEEK